MPFSSQTGWCVQRALAADAPARCLLAENINWNERTICFTRKKLKGRAGLGIKPTLFRFSAEIEALLKRRPASGPLFSYLCTVRAGDRATEFKQRCDGLGIPVAVPRRTR